MRILLTGTSGQVGGALLAELRAHGDLLTPQRAEFDFQKPEKLVQALDTLRPDLIVNPAAYTAVDRAEEEANLAFLINAEAPSVLARWAAQRNVPLIHFSTDYVFDGAGDERWCEDSPTGPLSVYGASKLAGEKAIQEARGSHLIVRTSWVYAADGLNFLRTILRLAQERKELRIVADQFGSPTSARVISTALGKILGTTKYDLVGQFSKSGGIVNLSCAGETSWYGFAAAIIDGLKSRGIELKVEFIAAIETGDYPTKAARPLNSRLELSRLRDVFGIVTPSWNDALAIELDELTEKLSR
jgi:dTDP-4-dehydrorhamnose reductase